MRSRWIIIGIIISGAGVSLCRAQGDSPSTSIISRSPFIPAGFNPAAQSVGSNPAQVSASGYEFRGVYQIGDRYWFLISQPQSRDGNWIELGKNFEDVEARKFDPATKALTVFANNTEQTLELAQLESNPKPIPVQGLVKTTARTPTKAPTPVRRTISPTAGEPAPSVRQPDAQRSSTPPPAWLEKLRAEAAERRAQASRQTDNNPGQGVQRRTITPNRPPGQGQEDEGDEEEPPRRPR